MNSKEFKKIYHPRLGRYVYEHRGNGLIVDNLFKPLQRKAKEIGKKVVKPFLKAKAKEIRKKGLSKAGEKIGQKVAQRATQGLRPREMAGDLIQKRLNKTSLNSRPVEKRQKAQDVITLINNLIAMS